MQTQQDYWDRVAAQKVFTHPIDLDWMDEFVPRQARLLDYGCGYGRTLRELAQCGYGNTVGVDFSPAMIARGRQDFPDLDLRVAPSLPLDEADASFDAVLLLAVLTCIPGDREQDRLLTEVHRLLRPGGICYISDMPLQQDVRNVARYREQHKRFGMYGVFETEDGAIVRHHAEARLLAWTQGFLPLTVQRIPLRTMNGHDATGVQILLRRG